MDDFYNKFKRFSLLFPFSFFLLLLSNSPKEKEKIIKRKAYSVGLLLLIVRGWSEWSGGRKAHGYS